MNTKENRQKLATACFCRAYLNIHGFLSDTENKKIRERIKKFQSKEEIIITESQLMSSECIYDDEAKEY